MTYLSRAAMEASSIDEAMRVIAGPASYVTAAAMEASSIDEAMGSRLSWGLTREGVGESERLGSRL